MDCHTVRVEGDPYTLDPSKLFAGGEPFEGPWGAVYSANITSDAETGIGAWTDEEIGRAITEGIGRDGTKLLVMPWEFFQGLSNEDVNNIVAYLRTLPAVKHTPPPAQLAPPEAVAGFVNSIPPLKAAVPPELYASPRDVFHDFFFTGAPSAVPPAAPDFTAPQGTNSPERGGYLVKNLLGCAFCHAPNLAGGMAPIFGPNITPDQETGIGAWSKEDIVRALREGVRPDGRRLAPVMPSAGLAFGNLGDDEVYNVVAYLQSVPAVSRAPGEADPAFPGPPPPPAGPPPAALPKTGDATAPWLALITLVGAGVLLSGLALRRRKA